jgi:undecaprenyl diphosphate synthase
MPATERNEFFASDRGRGLLANFDPQRVPAHVAIIMDGNGRWAEAHGVPRAAGHRAGAKAVEEAIASSIELGVRYLTLYAFSTENWRRPADEVGALMHLFVEVLKAKMPALMDWGVRVRIIGRLDSMPKRTAEAFRKAMQQTEQNTALDLIIALNYGGRDEIVQAARTIAQQAVDGRLDPAQLGEEQFASYLYTADVPDPDLLIRTSGEYRLSNFLLWQVAYAEIFVTAQLWPDFDRDDLLEAIVDYEKRERRYGGR